jgi:hypothetical protein
MNQQLCNTLLHRKAEPKSCSSLPSNQEYVMPMLAAEHQQPIYLVVTGNLLGFACVGSSPTGCDLEQPCPSG